MIIYNTACYGIWNEQDWIEVCKNCRTGTLIVRLSISVLPNADLVPRGKKYANAENVPALYYQQAWNTVWHPGQSQPDLIFRYFTMQTLIYTNFLSHW